MGTVDSPAPLAERLRALMAKATPLPWQVSGNRSPLISLHGPNQFNSIGPDNDAVAAVFYDVKTGQGFMDAKLIVEALNSLPTLLAALDGREAGWRDISAAQRAAIASTVELIETGGGKAQPLEWWLAAWARHVSALREAGVISNDKES